MFFRVPSCSKILSCASLCLGFPPVRGATLASSFRKGSVRLSLQILVSQREPNLEMVKNGRYGVLPASPWGRGWPPQSCFPTTLAGSGCLHALSTSPGENLKKLGVPRVCAARTGTLTASEAHNTGATPEPCRNVLQPLRGLVRGEVGPTCVTSLHRLSLWLVLVPPQFQKRGGPCGAQDPDKCAGGPFTLWCIWLHGY